MHIYPWNLPEIQQKLDLGVAAVVPLRPPLKVAVSWKAREKELGFLRELWETMVQVIAPYGPTYLPIESEHREIHLARVSNTVGELLKTDWPIVASAGLTAELTPEEENMFREYESFYNEACRP